MFSTPENSEWSSSEVSILNDGNILCSAESDCYLITKGRQSLHDTVAISNDSFADQRQCREVEARWAELNTHMVNDLQW